MRLEIDTAQGPAWADLDEIDQPQGLVCLGHGAGGGVEAVDIVAAKNAALAAGLAVARITQPYRVAGRKTPGPPSTLDPAWLTVVRAVRDKVGEVPLVTGGRSSGARVACRTATEAGAVGVITLAFPLHPPGRPEKSRLDELKLPTVPILVVQGDRDPFGMPPRGRGRSLVVIEGADHGLKKDRAGIEKAITAFLRKRVSR